MEMATEKQVEYLRDLLQRNGLKQDWIDVESLKKMSIFEADISIKVIRLLDKMRALEMKDMQQIIDDHNVGVANVRCLA